MRNTYSPEFKAKVVREVLREEKPLSQVAAAHGVHLNLGIFARLYTDTIEQMLEAELSAELGYEKYEAKGRNSGNNRNGHYTRKVRSGGGRSRDCRAARLQAKVLNQLVIYSENCNSV